MWTIPYDVLLEFYFYIFLILQNICEFLILCIEDNINSMKHFSTLKVKLISEMTFWCLQFSKKTTEKLDKFLPQNLKVAKSDNQRPFLILIMINTWPLISNKELFTIIKCRYLFDRTRILGQKFIKFLGCFFGKLKPPKSHSEIN